MMKYPLVTQEEEWGCGVACVASVLGCKYDKARTYFPAAIRNHAKYKGFSGLQLSRALLRGGKRYAKRAKHYKRDPLEPGTIVSLSKTKGKYKGSGPLLGDDDREAIHGSVGSQGDLSSQTEEHSVVLAAPVGLLLEFVSRQVAFEGQSNSRSVFSMPVHGICPER